MIRDRSLLNESLSLISYMLNDFSTVREICERPRLLWCRKLSFGRYIIEDLVTGGDLSSYLDHSNHSRNPIEDEEACFIVFQILEALQHLHQRSIVHRDLKPENILMSVPAYGARIILTDFGQARIAIPPNPHKGPLRMDTFCGTSGYVAP